MYAQCAGVTEREWDTLTALAKIGCSSLSCPSFLNKQSDFAQMYNIVHNEFLKLKMSLSS